ncbi:Glucose-repressible alcohol dehydrogenase, partial [Globisporangium splendens]
MEAKSANSEDVDLSAAAERKGSGGDVGGNGSSSAPHRRSVSAANAMRLEPNRDFVPARQDAAELSELVDLEKVSIVTYNMLSQMGARRMLRSSSGYVEPAILAIAGRREKLLREVLSYDADIMCLQEVDDYDDWWAAKLISNEYDSVHARRPGSSMGDGVLTAFRREVFQFFCSKTVELNDLCESIGDPNLQARTKHDNIALLVCLQPWEISKLPSALCIANTQLASGPALELVRVLQAEYLCRQIAILNADFHLPILLAGTFNALPSSDVYHVIHT